MLFRSAADAAHALGYARAADVLTPGPGSAYTFLNLPVASNDLLISYTLLGDANIDGLVNFDDLLALAKNYNATTNVHWSFGDFNYDNAINFDDLLILAKHYNGVLATPTAWALPETPANFATDLAAAIEIAQAPEPPALAAFAACGVAIGTGRRKRQRT